MALDEVRHLRVLIANEKRERLELLAQVVAGRGHEVIAREIYAKEVGAVTARERPDVALAGLGLHSSMRLGSLQRKVPPGGSLLPVNFVRRPTTPCPLGIAQHHPRC